jgi:glucose/arabinose dehydrogenase
MVPPSTVIDGGSSMRLRTRGLAAIASAVLLGAGLITGALVGPSANATQTTDSGVLVSQNKPVTASSSSRCCPAKNAVDGNVSTRWASRPGADPQWLAVDLGMTMDIVRVRLQWDRSCATAYRIETSPDKVTWTAIYSTTTGDGGVDDLAVAGTGRYVRMFGTHRCRSDASHGYSLLEFQVFTASPPVQPPHNIRAIIIDCHTVELTWDPPTPPYPAGYDFFHDGQLIATADGKATSVILRNLAPSTSYAIYVDARDADGNVSPSETVAFTTPPCGEPRPPTPPGNVHAASVNASCVAISWSPSADDVAVLGYYVYANGQLVATTSTTSATICSLTRGQSYTITVVAFDGDGLVSNPSDPIQITLPPPCVGPSPICSVEQVTTSDNVPWGLVTLPDQSILFTERDKFDIVHATVGGTRSVVGTVPNVSGTNGEGGLTGMAISPTTFASDHWLYLFHTSPTDNRIVRIKYENGLLNPATEQVLVTGIPRNHFSDGGRLRFSPDGRYLFAGTGDAQNAANAQNLNSLAGKILRLNPDGSVPADNPFPGTYIWSYGHRNVQGLAFDSQGRLWASEMGASTMDELNLITKGGNYGWPACEGTSGDCSNPAFIAPKRTFGVAAASPSGIAIVRDVIYMAALRGQRLYRMVITGSTVAPPSTLLFGTYGRLRTVEPAPGNNLWLTTSNGDGHLGTASNKVFLVTLA